MLTLGTGSTCDVCLEHFGADHKAPYSIHCGHVFCIDCLRRVSPPECPLCRTPYAPGAWLKLHVDISAVALTGADKEARKYQEAIGEVANQGSSETYLRQLINECRNFLQGQPRSMYADLRVTCRMVSYLCDVRSSLRTQGAMVESLKAEITQLTEEKGELLKLDDLTEQIAQLITDKSELQSKLEASEAARDKDKEIALDLESKLKEHVTRAENAYQTLLDCVVQEFANLNQELKDLRLKLLGYARPAPEPSNHGMLSRTSPSSFNGDENAHVFDQMRTQRFPVQSPDSYIPPVPEPIEKPTPTSMGPFPAVPEVSAEFEEKEEVYSRKKLVRCCAVDHPRSCQCDVEPEYSSTPPPSYLRRSSLPRPAFVIEHTNPSARRRESLSSPAGPEMQSGLSRTAPKNLEYGNYPDRIRIRSYSEVSPNPSRPPSSQNGANDDSGSPSEQASRSESPEPDRESGSPSSLGREGAIPIAGVQRENVRRLYNILQKPQPQLSTSPSSLSSSYNSIHRPRVNSSRSRSPSRSRSGSTVSHNPPPATSSIIPPSSAQPVLPQPSVISRASDAAMAIEKSQKERQMAEKALKEKEKEKERREHRKSDKDTERQEGERTVRKSTSGASVTTSGHPVQSSFHGQQSGSHHISGSPHRESYVSPPSISSASSAVNSSTQKVTSASTSSASHSLGRKNSMKASMSNYSRHNEFQRDSNLSHQTQPYRHGSGGNMHNSSTTPTISV